MTADVLQDAELTALFQPLSRYRSLVLAVSGGCDSCALLLLVSRWAKALGDAAPVICVATVDHQLRAESADEVRHVAKLCRTLGFEHVTRPWSGEKPSTGLQAAARNARYKLLTDVVAQRDLPTPAAIVTAHTEDDQSETVMMRLVRGSGLDGLAAMQPKAPVPLSVPSANTSDVHLLRPLLSVSRHRLAATLENAGITWMEDPSNVSDDFERVRVRKVMPILEQLGLTASALARTAERADRARQALDSLAGKFVAETVQQNAGAYARVSRPLFQGLHSELQVRVLQILLAYHGGAAPSARLSQIEALQLNLSKADVPGVTLGGCVIAAFSKFLDVFREPGRQGLDPVAIRSGVPVVWDQRFAVSIEGVPDGQGVTVENSCELHVEALGAAGQAALRAADDPLPWLDLPHRAALTLPVVRRKAEILAVPELMHASPPGLSAPAEWRNLALTKAGIGHFNGHNCCKMRFVGADRTLSASDQGGMVNRRMTQI